MNGDPQASPTVSVVITSYNYGRFIRQCLDSVLAQTFRDYEIVVIDDGSCDDTAEVVRPFRANPRFRYVRQSNQGQACAKNRGMHEARGRFVAFLDADDAWKPAKLERQVALFSDSDIAVVFTTADHMDVNGRGLGPANRGKRLLPRSGYVTRYLIFDNFVPFSSSMVRAEHLREVGGFDESLRMGIDWDLWLRLSVAHRFAYVDAPLTVYRIGHSDQMSRNNELRRSSSDAIVSKFLHANPNVLSPWTLRRAAAYRMTCRGYGSRLESLARSNDYYLSALRLWPLEGRAYKGLIRNLICHVTGLPK